MLILLGAVGLAFSVTAQYFSAKAAAGFVKKLRHVLFAHIQRLSYGELDTQGTSTLITRMTSDMNQVQSGVNLTLRLLLRSPFVVIGAMVMAFTVDPKSAVVFCRRYSGAGRRGFRYYDCQYSPVSQGAEPPGQRAGDDPGESHRRPRAACLLQGGGAGGAVPPAEPGADGYAEICGKDFRAAKPGDLCDCKRGRSSR